MLWLGLVWFGSRLVPADSDPPPHPMGPIQWAPSNGPPIGPLFFLIYKKYKKYDFLYFYRIDKNRLFSYIKNHLNHRKLISIIFYIFWFIQINFLKIFFYSQNSYEIIKNPSFSCNLIPTTPKNKKKVSTF